MEKKGYHITITDNRTGKVETDRDCDAVIASISDDETTSKVRIVNCKAALFANTVCELLAELKTIKAKYPEVYTRARVLLAIKEAEEI